ncbi:MAG: 3-deoxy-D-manno-octulosonic acid transferase [Alphaproteobacteria bacterium]|nr:3-deoxy-D-manno-octulosonic acid transferase [Alphaproteobacteria bacterium]
MTPSIYRCLSAAAAPLFKAKLRRRAAIGKEDAGRLEERLGTASLARPDGSLVWVHAISVGETINVLPLIAKLIDTYPRISVLLTTGTTTSASLAADLLPPRCRHQFVPIDLPGAVRRFLDHWRPDLGLFVESELWPNLLLGAAARDVPLALVGGRMSERTWRRWQRMPRLIAPTLATFDLVLARSITDADRFTDLGAADVRCVGDLKSAAPPLPVDDAAAATMRGWIGARPLWLAASTHAGEEEAVAEVHARLKPARPDLLTVIVPRHPERGSEIAQSLEGRGWRTARRSQSAPIGAATDIYLADTLGELGLFYRLTEIAFIGGSLVPQGGHNLLEAARLDCAILHGPLMTNFHDMAEEFRREVAAIEVADADALSVAVEELLTDAAERRRLASAARHVAANEAGILEATFAALSPLLDRAVDESDRHARA